MFNATPALFFDFESPAMDPSELEKKLIDAIEEMDVMGLSANQLGYDFRCMAIKSADEGIVVMFNPELTGVSKETIVMREGDTLLPEIFVSLKRPRVINLEYQDVVGDTKELTLDGLAARCVLHELDNLNGILFLQRASRLKLKRALKSRDKRYTKKLQKYVRSE